MVVNQLFYRIACVLLFSACAALCPDNFFRRVAGSGCALIQTNITDPEQQNQNITDRLAIKRLRLNMANIQPLQHPPFNFRAVAGAHRVLANQSQAFAENQVAVTPDGALLLQEIRNLRVEMNARFDRIEQRADTKYTLYPHYLKECPLIIQSWEHEWKTRKSLS